MITIYHLTEIIFQVFNLLSDILKSFHSFIHPSTFFPKHLSYASIELDPGRCAGSFESECGDRKGKKKNVSINQKIRHCDECLKKISTRLLTALSTL